MRALVFSAAILAMSATMAMAFPASFGLPHFVRVDQWPDPSLFQSEAEAQARSLYPKDIETRPRLLHGAVR